ncbi:XRE family transcriptional regulator [Enterococcus saccharolyticus]|uniref:HTH cro/C1-type domain-containing protein n=1 Tax=Enterococcus saccharolyticus subsp. saccharolyticus ATCC 43076 TaxID=1139996 RepID=S0JPT5_9ENTE|nr:XRE family transcriptional regulator [Enterococcus saccharolyticus]EOT30545.1 hypothetical protein OMQ_00249 [Enterococcus saccharolyticus subsp. saccharolyticus ATCC 43076]EOT80106.1 hypothetical protein I572_00631 [Enterococcus saccharolyticus subsp. saccharolyticus ATCC 43076]OJG87917.1 hypothetical protein RV16_GL000438 [Enterococcus saccharolyticus]
MEDGKAYKMNLELIKKARIEKGDSLQKMVNLIEVLDKTKYYRRENGIINFKPEEIPLIAHILEIPLEKMFIKVSKKEIHCSK